MQVSLFFATIKRIFKSLTSLLVSFACITYLFALTGVHIFGGLVNKDPARSQYETLQNTAYGASNFYSLNFNSVPSAVITLICLLRVSGWDTIAVAFGAVTRPAARVYFVLWYLIGVLFLMNIVATLFISGFVVEAATSSTSGQQQTLNDFGEDHHGMSLPQGNKDKPVMAEGAGTSNPLSESLLSKKEVKSDEKSSSLRQLANQLSQFMSPLSAAISGKNVFDTEQQLTDAPSSSSPRPTTWNPDISRLTKGSAIRDITTAQEGGKFYMVSMPKYAKGGGNLNVDGGMVEEKEEEVNKKFMKRIHSFYSQDGG